MFNPVTTMFMALLVAIAGGSLAYIYYGSYSLVAVGLLTTITLLPVLVLCYFKVYRRYGATLTAYILAVIAGAVNLVSFVLTITGRVTGEEVSHSVFVPVALGFSSAITLTGYTVYAAFTYKDEKIDVQKMWKELPTNFYTQPNEEHTSVAEEYVEAGSSKDAGSKVVEETSPTEEPNTDEETRPPLGTGVGEGTQESDHNDQSVEDSVYRKPSNPTETVNYKPKEFEPSPQTGTEDHPESAQGVEVDDVGKVSEVADVTEVVEVSAAPKWKVGPARAAEPETQDNLMFMPQRNAQPRRGL